MQSVTSFKADKADTTGTPPYRVFTLNTPETPALLLIFLFEDRLGEGNGLQKQRKEWLSGARSCSAQRVSTTSFSAPSELHAP